MDIITNGHVISLSHNLFNQTLKQIVETYHLEEQLSPEGGEYLPLHNVLSPDNAEVGCVRLFTGKPLFRLVACSIAVPAMQLDSHMLFAFTPDVSAVPHFTLDAVNTDEHFSFHLDLIPRVDLGDHLAYMDEVFTPLTTAFDHACNIEGLQPAKLSPRQRALMSPWMLAHRANLSALEKMASTINAYRQHWFALLDNDVSEYALKEVTSEQLITRNRRNKSMLFSSDIDPVWQRIGRLIGEQAVSRQQQLLIGDDE